MRTQKNIKAFEQIYNETYNDVLKFVICKCSNLDDVDDIIQETYLEFYKILQSEKEILDKKSYIITIAKNKIIKNYKMNGTNNNISLYQEKNEEEYIVDIDARD